MDFKPLIKHIDLNLYYYEIHILILLLVLTSGVFSHFDSEYDISR